MALNSDKPRLWKEDIAKSVDLFNRWFVRFAPKAYRETRRKTTSHVEDALIATGDLATITPAVLKAHPAILPTLRMATCPPLARDRLIGLAHARASLVHKLENGGLPSRFHEHEQAPQGGSDEGSPDPCHLRKTHAIPSVSVRLLRLGLSWL